MKWAATKNASIHPYYERIIEDKNFYKVDDCKHTNWDITSTTSLLKKGLMGMQTHCNYYYLGDNLWNGKNERQILIYGLKDWHGKLLAWSGPSFWKSWVDLELQRIG